VSQRAWVEQLMGMPVSIHLRGAGVRDAAVESAVAEAFADLRHVDEVFSTWKPESQVSRVRRGELAVEHCDPMVAEVVGLCALAAERTEGAFTSMLPAEDGELRLDPTGLVKGWAVERAAAILAAVPSHSFCVNAGGDVAVGGVDCSTPGPPVPWRVGLEDPRDRSRIAEVVELLQGGVATSGTAARGAHLYSPDTQEWVAREGSVSVVGPSLTWADLWATALFVGSAQLRARFAATEPELRAIDL